MIMRLIRGSLARRLRSIGTLVRRDYYTYAIDEILELERLLETQRQGIRLTPGCVTRPGHREKETLWKFVIS